VIWKRYGDWEKTNLRLELLAWSKIDFFLGVLSSSNTLGSIQVCCHRAWMVLHIPFHIQRKLSCASLFFHTSNLSTPFMVAVQKLASYTLRPPFTSLLINNTSRIIKSRPIEIKFARVPLCYNVPFMCAPKSQFLSNFFSLCPKT